MTNNRKTSVYYHCWLPLIMLSLFFTTHSHKRAVSFLASDDSSFITGTELIVAGVRHNFEGTTHVRKRLMTVAGRKLIVFLTLICKGSLYPNCLSQTNKQLFPTCQIKLNICIMNYSSQHS